MQIGLISDTHGRLHEGVHDAFKGVDYIIHAGDIGAPSILWELESIAPTMAVLGNNDFEDYGASVRDFITPTIGGLKFYVTHYRHIAEELACKGGYKLIIHGHTHLRRDQVIGSTRLINPGSATRPRNGEGKSCAILRIDDGIASTLRFISLP